MAHYILAWTSNLSFLVTVSIAYVFVRSSISIKYISKVSLVCLNCYSHLDSFVFELIMLKTDDFLCSFCARCQIHVSGHFDNALWEFLWECRWRIYSGVRDEKSLASDNSLVDQLILHPNLWLFMHGFRNSQFIFMNPSKRIIEMYE